MPSITLALDDKVIDVWAVPIHRTDVQVRGFSKILSADEAVRAGRLRFDHLRRSFIFTRGLLRILLGHYLSTTPEAISFSYGPQGKPAMCKDAGIYFNISHSGDLVLLAFTRQCDIGIDIEQIGPLPDMGDLAEQFFSPEELSQLDSIPHEERERAFFACWTRKEAYLKALGDGLSVPLDSFCVSLSLTEPTRLEHINGDIHAAEAWTLQDLTLASGYAAAIAYRAAQCPLRFRSLDDLTTL